MASSALCWAAVPVGVMICPPKIFTASAEFGAFGDRETATISLCVSERTARAVTVPPVIRVCPTIGTSVICGVVVAFSTVWKVRLATRVGGPFCLSAGPPRWPNSFRSTKSSISFARPMCPAIG